MDYTYHQKELWTKISQIVNQHPEHAWTAEDLSKELGIDTGSPGFAHIVEVLDDQEFQQQAAKNRAKIGFPISN